MALLPFIFNDESKKNSHGFYLLNAGGNFERFNANPVMLDNHDLNRLIGKWQNLRTDGVLLLADPLFDEGTVLGAERKGQVERGFLKGASPGIIILDAQRRQNIVTGNDDLYVTKWELFEGSTTPVPSNAGAVTLKIYDSNHSLIRDEDVNLHIDRIVKLGLESKESIININQNTMEKITLTAEALVVLGINESADAATVSASVIRLQAAHKAATEQITSLQAAILQRDETQAKAMVALAIKEGRIPADKEKDFRALALSNYDLAKSTLEAIPVKESLAARIKPITTGTIPAGREKWTHLQWLKEDPKALAKIKVDDPQTFAEIRNIR